MRCTRGLGQNVPLAYYEVKLLIRNWKKTEQIGRLGPDCSTQRVQTRYGLNEISLTQSQGSSPAYQRGSQWQERQPQRAMTFKTKILVLDGTGWKCLSLLHRVVTILARKNILKTGSRPHLSVCCTFPHSFPPNSDPRRTSCHRSAGSALCPHSPRSVLTIAQSPRAALPRHAKNPQ